MFDLRLLVLLCALLGAVPPAHQETAPPVPDASERYPATRCEEVVRFVMVKTDEPELGPMAEALGELGASVVYGPRTTSARPGRSFFAIRAPWNLKTRDLERAARKAGGAADELACTAFEGREGRDQKIDLGGLSFTSRDFVMGISGDIVWFDSIGESSQFYGPPGKLEPEDLIKRYEKLYAPYGGGTLGRVVRERFTWTLGAIPDQKQGSKLVKSARKLEGVSAVELDADTLTVEVYLADLSACLPGGTLSGGAGEEPEFDAAGMGAPRATWCTRPLWDLLESLELAPGS